MVTIRAALHYRFWSLFFKTATQLLHLDLHKNGGTETRLVWFLVCQDQSGLVSNWHNVILSRLKSLNNRLTPKMDGAQASHLYLAVGISTTFRRVGGRGGRDAAFCASQGETASGADLGGSKYSNENFEDWSGEKKKKYQKWHHVSSAVGNKCRPIKKHTSLVSVQKPPFLIDQYYELRQHATLLREKSIRIKCTTINLLQQRKNVKPVQSCSTRCGNNVALKIVCRRHVARIDFLCNNIALQIVNRPLRYTFRIIVIYFIPHPSPARNSDCLYLLLIGWEKISAKNSNEITSVLKL